MGMLDGLDLEARAALLGLTPRQSVVLGQSDRRLFAAPSLDTAGSVARLKRWLAAGSPAPDFARLEFTGADEVRSIVIDVLRQVPTPVAWHGVEYVTWIEVGRRALGWQGVAHAQRTPEGDMPHVIALSGTTADADFPGLVAHELGHSWSRVIYPDATPCPPMSTLEWTARTMVAAKIAGVTQAQLLREHLAKEHLADDLARLWGFTPPSPDDSRLVRRFGEEQADAAELAKQIETELEGAQL